MSNTAAACSNADWQRAIGKPYVQPQPIKLRRTLSNDGKDVIEIVLAVFDSLESRCATATGVHCMVPRDWS